MTEKAVEDGENTIFFEMDNRRCRQHRMQMVDVVVRVQDESSSAYDKCDSSHAHEESGGRDDSGTHCKV